MVEKGSGGGLVGGGKVWWKGCCWWHLGKADSTDHHTIHTSSPQVTRPPPHHLHLYHGASHPTLLVGYRLATDRLQAGY